MLPKRVAAGHDPRVRTDRARRLDHVSALPRGRSIAMIRSLAAFALLATLALAGCNKNKDHDMDNGSMSNEPKKMSTDACSHCAGVQTATADGKCPVCGAPAKK